MNIVPTLDTDTAQQTGDGLWYKDAIVYQLHVKAFQDSNADGVGDFAGLIERLDYLHDLSVTALWLLPFYPSPGRDDGYDISDYGDINPAFGTMRDFRRFMQEAKRRGLRVITELVLNHTSDQHTWFKRAKRSPKGSSARDWYVWSDNDQKYAGTRVIFADLKQSNWTWDDEAQAYYWHRFFPFQPDLNFDNPRVVSAVMQVMKRWLDAGVDGFRLDAVPYLCEREGTSNESLPETHAVLRRLRAELDAYAPNKVLLAEANQWPEDVQAYFGDGDECHMAFHFPLMPRIYMALAQEDRFPIADIMRQTPEIPSDCQWALFLRNHDELTLEMVTDAERDYLWSTYAADPRARVNLGIRRRLAPLMDNDRRKIELMNSIMMSMPGTPIIYYGDEIGMGDNIYLGDRNGVRTPMQWTADRNGGFSRADPAALFLPPIMDSVYGYGSVNVEAQSRSLSSLLSWTKRLIGVRKSTKVFGRGSLAFIRPANRAVLAYVRQLGDDAILCVVNLSRSAQPVELDLSLWKGRMPREMLGRTRFPSIGDQPYLITLPPYGFFWFALEQRADSEPERILPRELPTLVVGDGWDSPLSVWTKHTFEHDVLPSFLPECRWFTDKPSKSVTAKVSAAVRIESGPDRFGAVVVDATGAHETARYFLPLTLRWARHTALDKSPASILSAVRRGSREGTLIDATAEPEFIAMLLTKLHAGDTIDGNGLKLEFRPTKAFAEAPAPQVVAAIEQAHANSCVTVDGKYLVKFFRRVEAGIHPEIEIGNFLSGSAHFRNVPALLGSVDLVDGGQRITVAAAHAFIENQGDAWSVTAASLDRFIDEQRMLSEETFGENSESASMLQRMRQIGLRTAELHLALASGVGKSAFAPEPIAAADTAAWADRLLARLHGVTDTLRHRRRHDDLSEVAQHSVQQWLERHDAVAEHIESVRKVRFDGLKTRVHGDFDLGQVLIVKDD
ncbi:MAG TPA: maltose alpha-D-glucosyltransferase, partial [Pseudolabrys sp.]|nr:maltose alpha-D-glucosyltransferase [Pseudolabrys sp.]